MSTSVNRWPLPWFLGIVWLLVPVLCPRILAARATPPERPNILFLFSDDQRADTLHALGNPHIRTPHLDRLCAEGTAFTRAYIMGSAQHGAVCVPSRAMLMSGRTLFRATENLRGLDTWPKALSRAGYRTFITGKWHNQEASVLESFAAGRGVFLGGMSDQFHVKVQDFAEGTRSFTNQRTTDQFSAEFFVDQAIAFLKDLRDDRPFCLYVAFTTPHDPRTPPEEYRQLYDPATLPLPANYLPQHPFNNGEMLVRDEKLLPWPRTPEAVRREIALYYALISHLDGQIGRLLAALEATGRYRQTLIVFAGDNGLALGSHGLLGKQNLYEHSMRVPLVVAGPGIARGRRSDAFCYLLDLAPTLCELAGLEPPAGSEGRSLAPLLRGRRQPVRDSVFTAYRGLQRAVRDDRWKLIRYPPLNRSQLFDLRADPDETRDLAGDPRHARQVQRMTRLLLEWQQRVGDSLPLSTNTPAPLEIDLR